MARGFPSGRLMLDQRELAVALVNGEYRDHGYCAGTGLLASIESAGSTIGALRVRRSHCLGLHQLDHA